MIRIPQLPALPNERSLIWPDYRLAVNGAPCPVRECRVSAMPFNRPFPGKDRQRSLDQTELAGFAHFYSDEAVRIAVEAEFGFERAVLRPLARGIQPEVKGRQIVFTLDRPGHYVLELDSEHRALHLFFDPPGEWPEAESATWHFGPGVHCPGVIRLRDNDTVFLDPEALVYGSLYGENVRNVAITGGGTLDGSHEERVLEHCYETYTKSTVKFYHSSGIRLEGITILNSACWSVNFFDCADVEVERIKIVGQWRYNTDGIDIVNSRRVAIRNSFVRSFDDAIVLKGIDHWFAGRPDWVCGRNVEDIAVTGCVLWCGWGRTCEIGIETSAPEFRRIRFEDCDLIHNSAAAIDLQNGMEAEIHDVVFRNIRVEYQADTMPEIMQNSDEMKYEPGDRRGLAYLINSENHHFLPGDLPYGATRDILFENIRVFAEPGVPKLPVRIASYSPEAVYRNHTIRNLTINGRRIVSPDQLDWHSEGPVENTVLE